MSELNSGPFCTGSMYEYRDGCFIKIHTDTDDWVSVEDLESVADEIYNMSAKRGEAILFRQKVLNLIESLLPQPPEVK